jgi:hypothetical protein
MDVGVIRVKLIQIVRFGDRILNKFLATVFACATLSGCVSNPIHPDQVNGVPVVTLFRLTCDYPIKLTHYCIALHGPTYNFDVDTNTTGRFAVSEDKRTVLILGEPSIGSRLAMSHPARAGGAQNMFSSAAVLAWFEVKVKLETLGHRIVKETEIKQNLNSGTGGYIIEFEKPVLVDIQREFPRSGTPQK